MNREWSDLNKTLQLQINKEESYPKGIETLLELRSQLMDTLVSLQKELTWEEFSAMPFINADGYHSKTIAYSLWHIFRIEDITAHTLVFGDEQIFFRYGYQNRLGSPIITTGNELKKQQIADFSKQLNLDMLFDYMAQVRESTEENLCKLSYEDIRKKVPESRRESLKALHVVSDDEKASWLIDYWCSKDIRGLIRMPFSRHWIMHTEACLRIRNKIHPPV